MRIKSDAQLDFLTGIFKLAVSSMMGSTINDVSLTSVVFRYDHNQMRYVVVMDGFDTMGTPISYQHLIDALQWENMGLPQASMSGPLPPPPAPGTHCTPEPPENAKTNDSVWDAVVATARGSRCG
jgi:hypothetical protein